MSITLYEHNKKAYDPEYHVCIYQLGWKLYWIVDSNYFFEEDGSTYIQFSIDTTQFDRLPKDRIDPGCYGEYKG